VQYVHQEDLGRKENGEIDVVHGDEAAKVLNTYTGDEHWSPGEEKKLTRKIDRKLLPILCFSYGLQYYDKAMLSQAVSTILDVQSAFSASSYDRLVLLTICVHSGYFWSKKGSRSHNWKSLFIFVINILSWLHLWSISSHRACSKIPVGACCRCHGCYLGCGSDVWSCLHEFPRPLRATILSWISGIRHCSYLDAGCWRLVQKGRTGF
jgi:hypothetical protein